MLVYVRHLLQEPKRLRLWQAPSVERLKVANRALHFPTHSSDLVTPASRLDIIEPIFVPEDWELGVPWRRLARGVGETEGVCQVIEPAAEVVDDLPGEDAPLDRWRRFDDLDPVDAVS